MPTKSKYQEELLKVRNCKCPECDGFGICDEMLDEFDELAQHEWTCFECSGTGFAGGIYTSNVFINKPPKKDAAS